MRIGLLSDTHGFLDPALFEHFAACDQIWHAGDIGKLEVAKELARFKPLRAVYGNIDDQWITGLYPRDLRFTCDGMQVFMTHIGGYPGRYHKRIKEMMKLDPPDLYICGHSHILKVIYDKVYGVLHMNPGACGHQGLHKVRTVLRFTITGGKVHDAEVIELGMRGRLDH